MSTLGDIMTHGLGVLCIHWGMFSTLDIYHEYIGEYHEYIGGYHEYIGGYHEYTGGCHDACWGESW